MYEEKESVKKANNQVIELNPLTAYKCDQAVRLLKMQIASISDVQNWADEIGYSRRWLCKSMKVVYGLQPKIILRQMKYEKIVWLIHEEGVNASCYSVAVDAGFEEAKKVSMFLSSYYNTNFTELKMKLLQENAQVKFIWLNVDA